MDVSLGAREVEGVGPVVVVLGLILLAPVSPRPCLLALNLLPPSYLRYKTALMRGLIHGLPTYRMVSEGMRRKG